MKILDIGLPLISIVEGIAYAFGSIFKSSMPDYTSLATSDGEFSLVTDDGSYVSGFEIEGLTSSVGQDEFYNLVSRLTDTLKPFLKTTAHTVQIFASRDSGNIKSILRSASERSRATLDRLNLKLHDVADSREENLANFCADEKIYLALWTHPTAVPVQELSDAVAKRKSDIKRAPPNLLAGGGQDLFCGLTQVREAHEAFYLDVAASLTPEKAHIVVRQLNAHEMLRAARKAIDESFTSDEWKACLPGDPIPFSVRNLDHVRPLGISDIQYPPLSWQLFPRDGKKVENKFFEMGDKIFAPVFIETPPQDIQPFEPLFDKLAAIGIPWRTSFTLDGGGLSFLGVRAALSSYLSWAGGYNRTIYETGRQMREQATSGNVTHVRLKMAFCTWADAGDIKTLKARLAKLVNAVQSWGNCEVRQTTGSPVSATFSSVPFLSFRSDANYSVAPLGHVMRMLPIMRQASAWKDGSVLYRTRDGKVMPFEPGSSLQDTWNYLAIAGPGSGKSVQIANMLYGVATQPGLTKLPRIGIIDVGPSSAGLISLISAAQPPERRHQVAYIRLKNTLDYAVNIFDTFPGCRFPTPEQKALQINVLAQMVTPAERKEAYSSTSEIASAIIDYLYTLKSDSTHSEPNIYSTGEEPVIDKLLEKIGVQLSRTTSWWRVVDILAEAGYMHESYIAQRHCSPTMTDVPAATRVQTIVDQYGKPKVETSESLCEVFGRLISSAVRMYPMLSGRTKFDLGDIRICALDVDEVAKAGSAMDERMTGLMYLVARYILTKDYKLDAEYFEKADIKEIYRKHLVERAIENKKNMKWIAYDEFHRTKASPAAQDSVIVDMREGRKWNLGVILASQDVADFSPAIKNLATGVFILKAPNSAVADELQRYFGLNDTTRALLLKYCNGPNPRMGAPMIAHLSLKSGVRDLLLYSTLGPIEMWGFSTTAEDVVVRDRTTAALEVDFGEMSPILARAALAKQYPGGVKDVLEKIKRASPRHGNDAQDLESAYDFLVNQVVSTAIKMQESQTENQKPISRIGKASNSRKSESRGAVVA